jgi:hypothetical protein
MYSTAEGGKKISALPGWGCPCSASKSEPLIGYDAWPILTEPLAPGDQRRVGFVFLSGEEAADVFRKAGTFYLWEGRFVGEARVVESEVRLLSPWQLPYNPEALASELNREVGPLHPLFGKCTRALAVARDRDDVFFEILGGRDCRYAVVHLTWAGQQEAAPTCPSTRFFGSLDEWHTWMTEDHEDFTWGDTHQL